MTIVQNADTAFRLVEYLVGGLEKGHPLRQYGRVDFILDANIVDVVNGYGRHVEYCATFTQAREYCKECQMGIGEHLCKYVRDIVVLGHHSDDNPMAAIHAAGAQASERI